MGRRFACEWFARSLGFSFVFAIRGHRARRRASRGHTRDIHARGGLHEAGGGLPMVPQYFIISRDARTSWCTHSCLFVHGRGYSISAHETVSTRALRHATPRCCAYTSPIKCRINFGALHILDPRIDEGSRREKCSFVGEDAGRWYFRFLVRARGERANEGGGFYG